MKRLSPESYWDSVYKKLDSSDINKSPLFLFKEKIKFYTRDYSNYLMWEKIFPKFLPKNNNLKIIEVGCAPGKYLIDFNKEFGYEPHGVEYSEKGVEITKNNFLKYNLNEKNIIQADFFDEKFQLENKEKYDIIFSRGFIEHFDDVKKVVNDHLNLLKTGGRVVVMIPNLSGLNFSIANILNKDSLLLHNLSIMNKKSFNDLFDKTRVETLYSGHVGVFSFGLFNTNKKWKKIIHRLLLILQRPVDFLLRLFIRSNLLKSHYTSPYLLFIGIKR